MPKVYLLSELDLVDIDGDERLYVTDDPAGTPADAYLTLDVLMEYATSAFGASVSHPFEFMAACSNETTAIDTTGVVLSFPIPADVTLTSVHGYLTTATTAASAGLLTFDIEVSAASIYSTVATFDATENFTSTAATPPVLSPSEKEVVDITGVGDSTAAGLKIMLKGTYD